MQSLAAFTPADFKFSGCLDYSNFLRATTFVPMIFREKQLHLNDSFSMCF